MKKQVGLYGGSFDPIHLGHLNLAVQMLEAHKLDEVLFCPTAINPLKSVSCFASANQRIEMLNLAIEQEPRFHVLDIEVNRAGPSYTIDTIHQLIENRKEQEEEIEISLIIGGDAARSFHRWHQPEEIIRHAHLLIGSREMENINRDFQGSPQVIEAIHQGLTPIHVMEISSTEIRDRLARKLCCWHLLPGKVLDYILSHELY